MKTYITATLLVACATVNVAEAQAEPVILEKQIVYTDTDPEGGLNEELNFAHVFRFSNGVIHLNGSIGIQHGNPAIATERSNNLVSFDDGATWQKAPFFVQAENTVELDDGSGLSLRHFPNKWEEPLLHYTPSGSFAGGSSISGWPGPSGDQATRAMKTMQHLGSGQLLQSGFEETNGTMRSYINRSLDTGSSWSRLATFTSSSGALTESSVIQASNGDLLMASRGEDPSNYGIWFSRSTNHGLAWTPISRLDGSYVPGGGASVSPGFFMTDQGQLILAFGKRESNWAFAAIELWISEDGTGQNWDTKFTLYDGAGSGYSSITQDGDILYVYYDESGVFGHDDLEENRLVRVALAIPEPSAIAIIAAGLGSGGAVRRRRRWHRCA